jgi:hypothetical protein
VNTHLGRQDLLGVGDYRATGWLAAFSRMQIKTKVWNGPLMTPAGNEAADRSRPPNAVCRRPTLGEHRGGERMAEPVRTTSFLPLSTPV